MHSDPTKLPTSAAARVIALLLLGIGAFVLAMILVAANSALYPAIGAGLSLVFFAVFLIELIRLYRSAPVSESLFSLGRAAWIVSTMIFWAIAIGLGIVSLGYGTALAMPSATPLLVYALAFLTIVLATASSAAQIVRRRRTLVILTHLERALELNLPLSRMILAAADSETGALRIQLLSLGDHLDRGEPLDEALAHAVPNIPDSIIRTAGAGERIGRLPHVLGRLISRRVGANSWTRQMAGVYRSYPIVLLVVAAGVIVFVLPKFELVFRSFRMDLPPVTRWLVTMADHQAFLIFLLPLLALAPVGRMLAKLFPSFRAVRPFGGVVVDHLLWWTPWVHGFLLDRSMADLCDLLGAGIEAGRPLTECLGEAAGAQANAVMRYRLRAWADAVARGQSIQDGARYARLPSLFVAMIATGRDTDGLVKVLAFLWRHYEYRCDRVRIFLRAAYVPAIVFLMGALVALVGLALFQPLAELSGRMTFITPSGGF